MCGEGCKEQSDSDAKRMTQETFGHQLGLLVSGKEVTVKSKISLSDLSQSGNGSSGKKDSSQSSSGGSDIGGGQDTPLNDTPHDASERSNGSRKRDSSQSISVDRDTGGGQDSFVNEMLNEVNKTSNDSSLEDDFSLEATSTNLEFDLNLDGNNHHALDSLVVQEDLDTLTKNV